MAWVVVMSDDKVLACKAWDLTRHVYTPSMSAPVFDERIPLQHFPTHVDVYVCPDHSVTQERVVSWMSHGDTWGTDVKVGRIAVKHPRATRGVVAGLGEFTVRCSGRDVHVRLDTKKHVLRLGGREGMFGRTVMRVEEHEGVILAWHAWMTRDPRALAEIVENMRAFRELLSDEACDARKYLERYGGDIVVARNEVTRAIKTVEDALATAT